MKPVIHTISPPANLREEDRVFFAPHHARGRFFNPWQDARSVPDGPIDLFKWQLSPNPWKQQKRQEAPLTPVDGGLGDFRARVGTKVLWIGHASFLVEVDGFRMLIDPVFGSASPFVPRKAPLPFGVEALAHIDCVLITHGHYDHLDVDSLKALRGAQDGDAFVVVPLGLGDTIPGGFKQVIELDWWGAVDFEGVRTTLVPAQHWHRRGLTDTNKALWGGYVIEGTQTLYHSGDSGYFGGFRVIGERFPQIALAMLPVGAYEPRWFMCPQHMNPAESLQAFDDLGAANFVAMHWGTFDLTDEPLRQGAARLEALVREQQRPAERFHVLRPGESMAP